MFPILCYPETHFRFKKISPSYLFTKEPEIIFDLPFRKEPNQQLFLSLIINHIDLYPIEVDSITVEYAQLGSQEKGVWKFTKEECSAHSLPHSLEKRMQAYMIPLSSISEEDVVFSSKSRSDRKLRGRNF